MADVHFIWDLEDDPQGNVQHVLEHGLTMDEVEEVLLSKKSETEISRTSGNRITFGWTSTGSHIAVLWEHVQDDPLTILPLTAYPVEPRKGKDR